MRALGIVSTCLVAVRAGDLCPGQHYGTPPEDFAPIPPSVDDYAKDLDSLDVHSVIETLEELFINSQNCWPADFGNYGPFFVRLAWHCSGSYRYTDGKGGCTGGRQRFEPERSWADNTNLDKARALLWPVKEKFGDGLSWGDLFTMAGTVAIKHMGGPIDDICIGRIDAQDGTESLDLGPTPQQEAVAPCEVNGLCKKPLGSTTIGLIYLNPEGPVEQGKDGEWTPNPDPAKSVLDVKDSFSRMGFNDEETVALIGGGHAFGKTHGACATGPGQSPLQNATHPWQGTCTVDMKDDEGKGANTYTSGFEGPWTTTPTQWSNEFFRLLKQRSWEKIKGPGDRWQWQISGASGDEAGIMRLTSDVALLHDDGFVKYVDEFASDVSALEKAFAAAWLKLTTDGGRWSHNARCIHGSMPWIQRMRDDELVIA